VQLDRLAVHREAGLFCLAGNRLGYRRTIHLTHLAAFLADQKLRIVMCIRATAADKSIQTIDPMHQAMRHEKLQRAVNGWRAHRLFAIAQAIQQIIGFHRFVTVPDQFKHAPAHGGQTRAALTAERICPIQRPTNTFIMRVTRTVKDLGIMCMTRAVEGLSIMPAARLFDMTRTARLFDSRHTGSRSQLGAVSAPNCAIRLT
jgi:hypothetical protein